MGRTAGPIPGLGLYALLGQHNMRAFSCEMGVARMPGARRHWIVAGTIVVLLSGLASGTPLAQDAKLVANCAAPQPGTGSADASPGASPAVEATVSCELRSTDAVVFKGVKAIVKGRSEPLEADFKGLRCRQQFSHRHVPGQVLTRPGARDAGADGRRGRQDCRAARRQPPPPRRLQPRQRSDPCLPISMPPSAISSGRCAPSEAVALPLQLYKTSLLDAIAKLARRRETARP